jgi:hypothetical protein
VLSKKTRLIAAVALSAVVLLPSVSGTGSLSAIVASVRSAFETTPPETGAIPVASLESIKPLVASYCDAMAAAVPSFRDLGHFHAAQKVADEALQSSGKLPTGGWLTEFDVMRSKRLEAAMGGNLNPDQTDLSAIAGELRAIATELRK